MLHLQHYLKGKAKEATEACAMLPPEAGYERVHGMWKNLQGPPHKYARSLINGLFESSKTSRLHADMLSGLVVRMESCKINLDQMDCTADLNLLATLKQILKQLPYYRQSKWAENLDWLTRSRKELRCGNLATLRHQ